MYFVEGGNQASEGDMYSVDGCGFTLGKNDDYFVGGSVDSGNQATEGEMQSGHGSGFTLSKNNDGGSIDGRRDRGVSCYFRLATGGVSFVLARTLAAWRSERKASTMAARDNDTNNLRMGGHALVHLVLVLALILAGAAGPTMAAFVCKSCIVAEQINRFCTMDEKMWSCCDVVTYIMDASYDNEPPCLCRLDDCEAYLVTGYMLMDLLEIYKGCAGERPDDAEQLVNYCSAPLENGRHEPAKLP